ncbi:hypothetical protein DRN74_02525 [Candidatus Micrarchaeota archaeon]|mgnify:CR=1 FL=1|nr:MAG: hypothetical protein DRN74_02525 [Candidatus Micrarchaeota archaeon]
MTKLFDEVKQFVKESFEECGYKEHIKHLERTVYWVKKLKPNADEALLIAAISHDIGTAHRWKKIQKELHQMKFTDKELIEKHQKECARIIEEFLRKQGANPEIIDRVKMLVSKHEEGGNADQNLLKDADSISFFENNIPVFLNMAKKIGKGKVKQKFDWMYNRMTSEKARRIVKKWYDKAIKDLRNV